MSEIQNNTIEDGVLYVKNSKITMSKEQALLTIEQYNTTTASTAVKQLVQTYKEKINNASNLDSISEILDDFQEALELEEKKDAAVMEIQNVAGVQASDEVNDIVSNYKRTSFFIVLDK